MATTLDTDWREILSLSQKELKEVDKDKLCESLCWMEADDIELNFADLKTLFRLSQDMLKFKCEQVNNAMGQLEARKRKKTKIKEKSNDTDDTLTESVKNQEEIINKNKKILDQLYADIADLESRKSKLQEKSSESESSRDPLSELNQVAQLEQDNAMKNKHIRKLLSDVKLLEEDNTNLKEKIAELNDKLTEATKLIEHLTKQLVTIEKESNRLKDMLGASENNKAQLAVEIRTLKKEKSETDIHKEIFSKEVESKIQHWKNIARNKKSEAAMLLDENTKLKKDLLHSKQFPLKSPIKEKKLKELQIKLYEATNEILHSAKLIENLKEENQKLKVVLEKYQENSVDSENIKNESDDGKERNSINKLKKELKSLSLALHGAEEMLTIREKELWEITSQVEFLKSDKSVTSLIENFKSERQNIKIQDEKIKKLVKEINAQNDLIDSLQLENECLRQKLNITSEEKIPTTGILKKVYELELHNKDLIETNKLLENELVEEKLEAYKSNLKTSKLVNLLNLLGHEDKLNSLDEENNEVDNNTTELHLKKLKSKNKNIDETIEDPQKTALIEENEGLRKGLQEILNFLKDSNAVTSGTLAVQCPSLETVLQYMEMRHAVGWFAPHMSTVMELRAALGGKDALLTALHETRKETYEIIGKLSKESQRSDDLEKKLNEVESKVRADNLVESDLNHDIGEFGSWMTANDDDYIDITDKNQISNYKSKRNTNYEYHLRAALKYLNAKFINLHDKTTTLTIQTTDLQNKWQIQEEQYKAQINNLKAQIGKEINEDNSDNSEGLVSIPNTSFLARKCSYLEESYKQIRTSNENLRADYLESKRDAINKITVYENQILRLTTTITNLTDKLRNSISFDFFYKQNEVLNDIQSKYRKLLNESKKHVDINDLLKRLESNKHDIINYFYSNFIGKEDQNSSNTYTKNILSDIEQSVVQKQLECMCFEAEERYKKIQQLETKNLELQETQIKLINQTLDGCTKEELKLANGQVQNIRQENEILKEQCHHIESQLNIALMQLQENQQKQVDKDVEINMLRHQILDLQSTGDSKAIIARLSGEIIMSHLQATERQQKIERLTLALNREKQMKIEAEEILNTRQNIFDVYASKFEAKFKYMYEVMQVFRQQYQSSLPLTSLENYINNIQEYNNKSKAVNENLEEMEDLRSNLMIKHTIYDQIIELSKNKCFDDENLCPHEMKLTVLEKTHLREIEHLTKKITTIEQSRAKICSQFFNLEKSFVLLNQNIEKSGKEISKNKTAKKKEHLDLLLEDVHSDEEASSVGSQTITLSQPKVLKVFDAHTDLANPIVDHVDHDHSGLPVEYTRKSKQPDFVNALVQTNEITTKKRNKSIQTDEDQYVDNLNMLVNQLKNEKINLKEQLSDARELLHEKKEDVATLVTNKTKLESKLKSLQEYIKNKEVIQESLKSAIKELEFQVKHMQHSQTLEKSQIKDAADEKNRELLIALKNIEKEKDSMVQEYKALLQNERDEYSNSVKKLHFTIYELQLQLDKKESNTPKSEIVNDFVQKYKIRINELEEKCFKLQSELDNSNTELATYQCELDRWKDLAAERLNKMEQQNSQLEERHSQEVESYKAENQHWLSQLSETQREHMELRSRLTEQKTMFMKQLSDKDLHIEQLRSVVNNLKTQIMNMQTLISVNDPSFDLSAIVELDEHSDVMSHPDSDRLELKFDSSNDLRDAPNDLMRIPATSTAIWQEPTIEKLRREKQFVSKQNAILRRQIKALAAREKRARLDAQNLKNQVFRISTSGMSKSSTAESAALHSKIASLQAQLTTARRDSNSTTVLWDKWKRAQQAADRWQARFEEKCMEVRKLEASANLAKTAVLRLEKEKRMLLTRLSEAKHEKQLALEKQDSEDSEKQTQTSKLQSECVCGNEQVLLERIAAQQRRILALQTAEKMKLKLAIDICISMKLADTRGNEVLVSEYEKCLAETTALKGQILKLESTLLESQIRTPIKTGDESNELQYWKSYCNMLKEENLQLSVRASTSTQPFAAPLSLSASAHHRVNDLEQTVLTLRGLVSKLQAEQKSSGSYKRSDSRPSSGKSGTEKNRGQLETYRTEIANLKRSILDKDLLLERSKEMLKIAAEREDELLRENATLRQRIQDLTNPAVSGFLSV